MLLKWSHRFTFGHIFNNMSFCMHFFSLFIFKAVRCDVTTPTATFLYILLKKHITGKHYTTPAVSELTDLCYFLLTDLGCISCLIKYTQVSTWGHLNTVLIFSGVWLVSALLEVHSGLISQILELIAWRTCHKAPPNRVSCPPLTSAGLSGDDRPPSCCVGGIQREDKGI